MDKSLGLGGSVKEHSMLSSLLRLFLATHLQDEKEDLAKRCAKTSGHRKDTWSAKEERKHQFFFAGQEVVAQAKGRSR